MQVPILSGVFTDNDADIRVSYPVNLIPVPKNSGVSEEYLRPADGLIANGTGPGFDRGAIEWNGVVYRVMGSKLVTVASDGAVSIIGDVGDDGNPVTIEYSFNLLGIASVGNLYFYDPTTGALARNIDPDLGTVVDMVWVDGYWMTTDGENLVVTELTDPFSVNPLKYGSSEADPDPVVALLKLRNEVYALNRYTIEVFDNIGGELFPFQRIDGAQIQKGTIGTFTCCVFADVVAFMGGGRNESPAIYLGANGNAQKISTQEIDDILLGFSEAQLATTKLEYRKDRTHQYLYVHLPDRTLVFDYAASQAVNKQIWFTLTSSITGFSKYRAQNFIWAFNRWNIGDPTTNSVGYVSDSRSDHYGQQVRWEFGTMMMYNGGKGAVIHELELVSLTGRVSVGTNPQIATSYSLDGQSWSQDRWISVGTSGNMTKRLRWLSQGILRNFRMQRFRGTSDAYVSFARLEAQIEALAY